MSSLNLFPNVTIVAIQAGVFATTIFIVNKLILKPYLHVKHHRRSQTTVKKEMAEQLIIENKARLVDLQEKIGKIHQEASKYKEDKIKKALEERDRILQKAEKKCHEILEETRERIESELKAESAKISLVVEQLSSDIFNKIMS